MAKKFRFQLDAVLRMRKLAEENCKRRVAEALRALARCQADLDALNRSIGQAVDQARQEAMQGRLDVSMVSKRRFWLTHLQGEALEADGRRLRAQQQLAQERDRLAEAVKAVKMLEKLRQKAFERYRCTLQWQDMQEADDLAVSRFRFNEADMQADPC